MFNGATDVPILEAGVRGKIITYIVCFGITYGANIGPVPNKGVAYNILTMNAQAHGFVPYVGTGSAVANVTHAADGVEFLSKIVTIAGTQQPEGSPYERYYILEGERVSWKDLSTALAKVLFEKGLVKEKEPKAVPAEDAGQGEIGALLSSNMLVNGERSKRIGYKHAQPSILVQLREDLA
jgi:nucleoside-diphosphate-sugar epimerase